MKQKEVFLEGEGDAYFERNKSELGYFDFVTPVISQCIRRTPESVLEIGCANGWRLAKLRDLYGCAIMGVEPSRRACLEAAALRVPVHQSTASSLPVNPKLFDLVIYGFCLYVTDPDDWLLIAAEGDRVLRPGGWMIIHDFGDFIAPHSMPYKHDNRLKSWHYDFAQLWLSHPQYSEINRSFINSARSDSPECVTLLYKHKDRP